MGTGAQPWTEGGGLGVGHRAEARSAWAVKCRDGFVMSARVWEGE